MPPSVDRTRLPLPGADRAFSLPAFERADLGGGCAVWAAEHRRAPLVALQLLLPAGCAADPRETPGLAALTAELLTEGTAELSAVELESALKGMGGVLATGVRSDATVVALTVLSRHVAAGLRLLFEVALRPRLDAGDVERERDLRINRIRQQRQSPGRQADRAFLEALYAEHPYGHLAIGTEAALRSVEPAGVAAFHGRVYSAVPWTLVAAGDVEPGALIAEAQRAWAAAAPAEDRRRAAGAPPDPPPVRERMVFVERDGAVQSELRLGHAGPARSSPDYHALLVLNMVLGGQFVSRVNQNLREAKGYTYGASTGFDWRLGRGPFRLQTSVQTASTADALKEAVREVADIRGARPPTGQELEVARAALTRGFPRTLETASQLARAGVQVALHGLPADDYAQFPRRVAAVGAADVRRAAARHLDPDRLVAVVVGSRPDVFDGLAELGFGDPVERPAV